MAFRAMSSKLRSTVTRYGGNRSFASSTTSSSAESGSGQRTFNKYSMSGEYAPVYMVGGMLVVAVALAVHSLKQQLVHSPMVTLNKKKRASMTEVEDPEGAIASADKFINKSFLRKVAHIQDDSKPTLPDAPRSSPFTKSRNAETLKTVGVETKAK